MTPAQKRPPVGPVVVTADELRARKRGDRPPEMLSSRELYQGKIITLNRDTVRLPDGAVVEMDIARHSGASAVVPFMSGPLGDEPQILLIRQYRFAAGGYIYEIPAGRLEPDEKPIDCALRELKEETGCTADHIEPLTTILTTPGFTDEVIHIFMASGLTMGEHHREPDEFVDMVIMRLSEALERIGNGEITDAKTVLSLLFAAGFKTS
ncbi:MAG: NUDIX hydrolase [Gemmatimonadota bacterium]|nr:NUDIX hydrolase [Gemmatimonadota bacterium]